MKKYADDEESTPLQKFIAKAVWIGVLLAIIFPKGIFAFGEFIGKNPKMFVIGWIIIVTTILIVLFRTNKVGRRYFVNVEEKELKLRKEKGKLANKSSVEYFRDFLCDNNLEKLYWILFQYDLFEEEADLIGAFIVKWVKDDKVTLIEKNQLLLQENFENFESEAEQSLFNMLKAAAGENNVLEINELKDWAKKNRRKLTDWLYGIIRNQTKLLEKEGLVLNKNGKKYISAKLDDEANKVIGFKKFLLDYSLIYEKYPIEVKIWEEYLILAQVIGIASKVKHELRQIYPNTKEIQRMDILCKMPGMKALQIMMYFSAFGISVMTLIPFAIYMFVFRAIAAVVLLISGQNIPMNP